MATMSRLELTLTCSGWFSNKEFVVDAYVMQHPVSLERDTQQFINDICNGVYGTHKKDFKWTLNVTKIAEHANAEQRELAKDESYKEVLQKFINTVCSADSSTSGTARTGSVNEFRIPGAVKTAAVGYLGWKAGRGLAKKID